MSSSNSNPGSGGAGGRPAQGGNPRVNTPARPPQRPANAPVPQTSARPAAGQTARPVAPGGRPVQGRPAPAGVRPAPAQTAGPRPQAAPSSAAAGLVRPAPKAKARRARLLISRVDPWSVLKMAFLLSVALGIVTVVAAIVLWTVLDLTGIFDRINGLLGEIAGSESGGFDLRKYASLGQVASFATILAVVNVVLLTALAMLSAVLYNISATLVGGIGVTLTDD
ncbi:DUF3566 domain-containing protein [Paenarthrobacter sp. DKR-5]|uniref:DUF3566 domain-containing protein n=1 Tax=Paenarthrobacter sp. DKR-5 TaxID=2835535 RepID=UPI001BDDA2BF|nr:DUF3566 domain-containing protein [Paenarthrobacter sp. DKR-5]MBT1004328.1 DUF3566 domain-containing protein [Paenarthrobacter sp. DKR-5]